MDPIRAVRGSVMLRALPVLVIAAVLSSGCTEVTSPNAFNTGIRIEPLVPLRAAGIQDTEVAVLPAVKILGAVSGMPIPGRVFAFTLESPSGAKEQVSVTTGTDGVATLPAWRLGSALGRYTATGVTNGWGPIVFSVMVPGKVVAIYDLVSINGWALPYTSWMQRHYVLYETGLFNRFVNMPATSFVYSEEFMGTYKRPGPETIEFEMECWTAAGQRCFPLRVSMAVRGPELIYDESDDFFGPWVEVYALRN